MAGRIFQVGVIAGSQRQIQAGSQITDWVQGIIQNHLGTDSNIKLQRINIKDLGLPIYDEPYPPAQITSSDQYTKDTTKAWSRIVAPLDAFVVVTPDYGSMGGTFSYENLKRSLSLAIKARVVESGVNLAFGPPEDGIVPKAVTGQDLGLSVTEDGTLWADKKGGITKGWDELVSLLNTKPKE
ncbi:hypothetical protein NM208_g2892 [Fusarium decemcellulare]|uniref:Uncharacterized protein n=1 Tax=Fusarium decemcellulare TaxID=57161 RepID=A0ACC1SQY8_9HYPO|nr:hypothetical protein NM208_g2892 [Fusarium decemcellulare]